MGFEIEKIASAVGGTGNGFELERIAENVGSGSGSGGVSGGGVMFVGVTVNGEDMTFNKTWREIFDAMENHIVVGIVSEDDLDRKYLIVQEAYFNDNYYNVIAQLQDYFINFKALLPDVQPTTSDDGGLLPK